MNLADLGWNPTFEAHFEPFSKQNLHPARVVREDKLSCAVQGERGLLTAAVSGKLRHTAVTPADLPAVGDWVAIEPRPAEARATIHAVLPRRSAFTRKAAGSGVAEQIAAANVDPALIEAARAAAEASGVEAEDRRGAAIDAPNVLGFVATPE